MARSDSAQRRRSPVTVSRLQLGGVWTQIFTADNDKAAHADGWGKKKEVDDESQAHGESGQAQGAADDTSSRDDNTTHCENTFS